MAISYDLMNTIATVLGGAGKGFLQGREMNRKNDALSKKQALEKQKLKSSLAFRDSQQKDLKSYRDQQLKTSRGQLALGAIKEKNRKTEKNRTANWNTMRNGMDHVFGFDPGQMPDGKTTKTKANLRQIIMDLEKVENEYNKAQAAIAADATDSSYFDMRNKEAVNKMEQANQNVLSGMELKIKEREDYILDLLEGPDARNLSDRDYFRLKRMAKKIQEKRKSQEEEPEGLERVFQMFQNQAPAPTGNDGIFGGFTPDMAVKDVIEKFNMLKGQVPPEELKKQIEAAGFVFEGNTIYPPKG